MTTMTTSVRGTPSFTPLPTQNTAPVHEFRCLFTHDAHKKAKKWHDGSVRFHTFNRRVMVYDDGRNYIGDHHFPQNEDFEEGVELRIDRGVLVDVGERLGETQTDVSSILERKKDDSSPQARKNIRLVAAASQKDQRPLSQILGTQSRIGRARLLPSPYQQRQALAQVQLAEPSMPPPPKRQRVDVSEQENLDPKPKQLERHTAKVVQRAQSERTDTRPLQHKAAPMDFQDVVDLSSDEETTKSAPKPPTRMRKNPPQKTLPAMQARPASEGGDQSSLKGTQKSSRKRSEVRDSVSQGAAESIRPPKKTRQPPVQGSSSCPRDLQPDVLVKSRTSQIVLRSPKPRRKLMYRPLLPSSRAQSEVSVEQARGESQAATSDAVASIASDVATGSQGEPMSPDRDIGSRRGSVDEPIDVQSSLPSSPLFIPEEHPRESPSGSARLSQDSLEAKLLDHDDEGVREASSQFSDQHSPVIPDTVEVISEAARLPDPFPSNQRQMLPPRAPLLAQLPPGCTTSPRGSGRPFRRVRSENDAFEDAEEDFPEFGFSVPPPSFLAKANASPARKFGSTSRSPAKLRRTASDSAVMDDKDELVVGYNIESIVEEVGETGPWTSNEAFLLFDYWPPGKHRPDHGVAGENELTTGQFGPSRVTITTARDMLRDEINVL